MKAKSDSRVQGCAGKPLNSRCATISYMEKSEKVVASNRTPKIEKTPFSLNWCKIYDFEPRRVCEDVRGRGRFIAEIDPTWTPDRVPIGRITPLCLFYNPHPLCSLWLPRRVRTSYEQRAKYECELTRELRGAPLCRIFDAVRRWTVRRRRLAPATVSLWSPVHVPLQIQLKCCAP